MQGHVRAHTARHKGAFDSAISNMRACLIVLGHTFEFYDHARLSIPLNLYAYSTILINAHNWVSILCTEHRILVEEAPKLRDQSEGIAFRPCMEDIHHGKAKPKQVSMQCVRAENSAYAHLGTEHEASFETEVNVGGADCMESESEAQSRSSQCVEG